MVSGFGALAPRAATSRLEAVDTRAPRGSAGGTRGDPRAQGAVAPGVRQHAEHEKARAARGAPRLEARGAASAPAEAEAEAEAREESARETRVDVAFPFNPAGGRRVRGRLRVATGSSPDEDACAPRAITLVDVGASRAAEVAAENAIVGSARPARGAASPGCLDEKRRCFARRGKPRSVPWKTRRGRCASTDAYVRAREERAWVSRRRACGTGGSGRCATRLAGAWTRREFGNSLRLFVHIWHPVEPNYKYSPFDDVLNSREIRDSAE